MDFELNWPKMAWLSPKSLLLISLQSQKASSRAWHGLILNQNYKKCPGNAVELSILVVEVYWRMDKRCSRVFSCSNHHMESYTKAQKCHHNRQSISSDRRTKIPQRSLPGTSHNSKESSPVRQQRLQCQALCRLLEQHLLSTNWS